MPSIQDFEINQYNIDATYSPEDNKLRIYACERLDDELWEFMKSNGFIWAPKQDLFVTTWSPTRAHICAVMAGTIEREDTTLAERAEAKADRLDALSVKRFAQSNAFHAAAHRISERFAGGQPILVGHHSEKKARRDRSSMDREMRAAIDAREAANYWAYRVQGVERHANMKNSTRTRSNRIKTLLAELRSRQRTINEAKLVVSLWERIEKMKGDDGFDDKVEMMAGGTGGIYVNGDSLYSLLRKGVLNSSEAIEVSLSVKRRTAAGAYQLLWIEHILNRLGYEQAQFGEVKRFDGELTSVVVQAFARTMGADKPKAKKSDIGFNLVSPVELPLHLGDGNTLCLSNDEWLDLMVSIGYNVPAKKERPKSTKKQAPLINLTVAEATKLQTLWNDKANRTRKYSNGRPEVKEMTQAQYSANSGGSYSPYNAVLVSPEGFEHRRSWSATIEPVCRLRCGPGGGLYDASTIIVISDKPQKSLPFDIEPLIAKEAKEPVETAA